MSGLVYIISAPSGSGKSTLVNELRKTVKHACDTLARLPMPGPIGSLNASSAAAIALYECVRQRGTR